MTEGPERTRWALLCERFTQAVLAGDEVTAHRQVARLHRRGVPTRSIITELLAPAAQAVGDRWADGTIGVAEEHRASEMMTRFMGELSPRVVGGRRGTVVVGTWSDEHHSLPTAMAAAALREDHWHVEHLGSGVPATGMLRFLADTRPDLAVLSVTMQEGIEPSNALASDIEALGIPALVGGPGRTIDELCHLAIERSPAKRRDRAN